MRALSLGGSRRGSSTVTHPCLGRGFLLALLARSLTTDARFGEILESLGGFRAGWSLGTIRRHGPGEVLAMGSCWDVPPTLGQSSPAPARSPAPPPPPLPRPPAPSPPRPGPVWLGLGVGLWLGFWAVVLLPAFPRLPLRARTCIAAYRAGLAVHLLAVVSFSAGCAPSREFLPPICMLT